MFSLAFALFFVPQAVYFNNIQTRSCFKRPEKIYPILIDPVRSQIEENVTHQT